LPFLKSFYFWINKTEDQISKIKNIHRHGKFYFSILLITLRFMFNWPINLIKCKYWIIVWTGCQFIDINM
jgi:hypothetical protein